MMGETDEFDDDEDLDDEYIDLEKVSAEIGSGIISPDSLERVKNFSNFQIFRNFSMFSYRNVIFDE